MRMLWFLLLSVRLFGQVAPADVTGWGKITWGMTIPQARAACGIAATDTSESFKVDVGSIGMKADIGDPRGTGHVTQVTLFMSFGLPKDPTRAGPEDFDTLKELLIQKYGAPASDESSRNVNTQDRTVLWTFPSTSITLFRSLYEARLGSITLRYRQTDRKALNAL